MRIGYNRPMNNNDRIAPANVPAKKIDNISKIIGIGPDTIKVIKNFLSKEECSLLVSEAIKHNTWLIKSSSDLVKMYKSKNHNLKCLL